MASTTESSAIVRFIHGAQPPILERQHSIETEVVANPYFEPVGGSVERPARRSYLPQLLLLVAAAAVIAALLIYWAERAPAAAPVVATRAPQVSPVVIPAAPEPEPIVIAVPSETEPEKPGPMDEPAPVVVASADTAPRLLRRAEREAEPPRRPAAARHGKARRRTEAPSLNSNKGVLMIASKPPCYILIDGKETGLTTPQSQIRLKGGRYELTLVNHEYDIRASIPVTIRAGKSVRVVKDLTDQMKREAP